jgi:hypothetical protein
MTTTMSTTGTKAGPAGDWRHRARCRDADVDPDLFFPHAERGPEFEAQVTAAKAVCAQCPVVSECLTWALESLPYGVAGGRTEQERRRYRVCGEKLRERQTPGRPVRGSQTEVAAAGRTAIRAGMSVREVAREFGVTQRTAERWAAQVCTTTSSRDAAVNGRQAEGSRGGHRAPLLISRAPEALAGTRAPEGRRG